MALNYLEIAQVDIYDAVFQIKELLKAAGWTVPESSDGTTYNAAGDQITSSGAGAGGLNNSLAWFRLQSANGAVEYTVQRGAGASTDWRVKLARAPFNAGAPGVTQTPTTTNPDNEQVVIGGGTDAAPTTGTLFSSIAGNLVKGAADDASPGFFFVAIPAGGGSPNGAWVLEPLLGASPMEVFPYASYSPGGSNVFLNGGMSSDTSSNWKSWTEDGLYPIVLSATSFYVSTTVTVPGGMVVDPINGKQIDFPFVLARRFTSNSANPAWKGVASYTTWLGFTSSALTGDTQTIDSALDRLIAREVTLPWKGTVPTGLVSADHAAEQLIPIDASFSSIQTPGAPSTYYLMQANDSVTNGLYTWPSAFPDWAGTGYPGPNAPTNVAISAVV